jgi:CRP/FNR family cyclic AMP-dependent transcriptional regulator
LKVLSSNPAETTLQHPLGNSRQTNASRALEEVLSYLPRKTAVTYPKRQTVFDEHHPPGTVMLLLEGRLKVTLPVRDGSETVVDIFSAGDFLGEWSFLYNTPFSEHAVALDDVSLLAWTPAEIEEQCQRHPQLGIRLIHLIIRRGLDYQARLQSFALEGTPERLVRSLLHFADRMGTRADQDFIEIPPLTHQVIADYVGTTREMINSQMNRWRRDGSLKYSRKGIQINSRILRDYLRLPASRPTELPGSASAKTLV